ncbi:MAG: hypothetical protein DRO06_03230 [Thermoproteota archaeon]|nr:MAG: hypothetical protein DRO06_03230 [Candidatus Korarchaeota archaeon]
MSGDRVQEVLEAIASLDPEETIRLAEKIRESGDRRLRSFRILVSSPWMASRPTALIFQAIWVMVAALSLIAGIYLLTPAYSFPGANATASVRAFLEAIAENPELLSVADPIMRLLGFAMIVVAVVAFYQAHMIRQAYEEFWGEEE